MDFNIFVVQEGNNPFQIILKERQFLKKCKLESPEIRNTALHVAQIYFRDGQNVTSVIHV